MKWIGVSYNKKMRDPEKPKENWTTPTPPMSVKPADTSVEDAFRYYLKQSWDMRKRHGIALTNGRWTVENLEILKSLPEWKKSVLRELVKSNPHRADAPGRPD